MRVLDWILETTWQASVLALLILVVHAACRKRMPPKWLYSLWFLLVARLMLPSLPESPTSIFNFTRLDMVRIEGASSHTAARNTTSDSVAHGTSAETVPPFAAPAEVTTLTDSPGKNSLTEPAPFPWKQLAAYLWICGVCYFLLRLVWSNMRFARALSLASPVEDQSILSIFEQCRARLNLKKPVLLLETNLIETPCVYGIRRKKLLLPNGFVGNFSTEELRDVFAHELAHIRRWDLEVNWITSLLQALHWFNPLLWIAFARMRADREIATDALALGSTEGRSSEEYGETILKVLAGFGKRSEVPQLVAIVESKSRIKQRLRAIARHGLARPLPGLSIALPMILVCFTLTDAVEKKTEDATNQSRAVDIRTEQPGKEQPAAREHPLAAMPLPPFPGMGERRVGRSEELDEEDRRIFLRLGLPVPEGLQKPIPPEIQKLSIEELLNRADFDPPRPFPVIEELVQRHEGAISFIRALFTRTESNSRAQTARQKSANLLKYFCLRLGSTTSEKLLPALIPLLSDTGAQIRGTAAEALSHLGANARTSVPALFEAVRNTPAALRALQAIDGRSEPTARAIVAMLNDPSADVLFRSLIVEVCRELIKHHGELVQDALLKAHPPADWRLQRKIAFALLNSPARSLPAERIVLDTFKDPHKPQFAREGEYLDLSVQQLIEYIRQPRVAMEDVVAVETLKYHRPNITDALPALIAMLNDENRSERSAAINGIAMMGLAGEPALPSLVRFLYSDHPRHAQAIHGIISIYTPTRHPKGMEILQQALNHEDPDVRKRTAWHLKHQYQIDVDPGLLAPARVF